MFRSAKEKVSSVRIQLDRVAAVIISCAVLHNISKHLNDDIPDEKWINANQQREVVEEENDLENADAALRSRGLQRRGEIANKGVQADTRIGSCVWATMNYTSDCNAECKRLGYDGGHCGSIWNVSCWCEG
ncbi:hypothetical protein JTB14_001068 [Gonioctena quinquepunctata]|nr:hypothetical protein JTB14_001068 [Gonioctena quinquepunctata]